MKVIVTKKFSHAIEGGAKVITFEPLPKPHQNDPQEVPDEMLEYAYDEGCIKEYKEPKQNKGDKE